MSMIVDINGISCRVVDIQIDGVNFWITYIDNSGNVKIQRNFQGIQSFSTATYIENARRKPSIKTLKYRIGAASPGFFGTFAANQSLFGRFPGPKNCTISRIRLWVPNWGLTDASISGAIITGVQTQAGNIGNGGSWKSFTFNSLSGTNIGPAETVQQPLTDPTRLCSFAVSDWIPAPIVSRTDGGNRPLFDVIARTGATGLTSKVVQNACSADTCQFAPGWYQSSSNWIATPPAATAPIFTYTSQFAWLEFEVEDTAISRYLLVGDSLVDGVGPTKAESGYIQLSLFANGIHYTPIAQGGRCSFGSWNEMDRVIPAEDYDTVVMEAASINDFRCGYSVDTVWQRYLQKREALINQGYRVLTVGVMPCPAESLTYPKAIEDKLIASGFRYFSAGNVVATDNTFTAWKPGYSSDGYHPNNTGTAALVEAATVWFGTYK